MTDKRLLSREELDQVAGGAMCGEIREYTMDGIKGFAIFEYDSENSTTTGYVGMTFFKTRNELDAFLKSDEARDFFDSMKEGDTVIW